MTDAAARASISSAVNSYIIKGTTVYPNLVSEIMTSLAFDGLKVRPLQADLADELVKALEETNTMFGLSLAVMEDKETVALGLEKFRETRAFISKVKGE